MKAILLIVPLLLMACATVVGDGDLPAPDDCLNYHKSEFDEIRSDPNRDLEMRMGCRQVMAVYNPTASPSLQALRDEFPEVVDRYWSNGGSRYLRANLDTREIHLDGCPEVPIQRLLEGWIIMAIEEECGEQIQRTPIPVPTLEGEK